MLNISKRYRTDYQGEDILTARTHEGHNWHNVVETVPNAITNSQLSNRAVVIGNGVNRLDFNLNNLKHPSGLLGSRTLQTYGCNALYRDFTPDFLVILGDAIIQEIATTGPYVNNNIVYTRAQSLLAYPGKFYLIPYDPYTDAGTTAAYIAAFDGHKTIYMLGFDGQDSAGWNNNVYAGTNGYDSAQADVGHDKWIGSRAALFTTYDEVDFVWVTPRGTNLVPELHKSCQNFRQISFRDFVTEADL